MQSRAFIYVISQAYRVEIATIEVYARAMKEAGLLASGARGVNAPHMTPADAARMTIALLATDSPARAPEMVRRFGTIPFRPDRTDRSWGPYPEALNITDGTTLEAAVTRLFASDLGVFDAAPYLEIQENARSAKIELGSGVLFFQDAQRAPEQRDADRADLFGIRRSRGLASVELMAVHVWFYLERRDGLTWEEHFSGRDENGIPRDPAHPENAKLPPAEREKRLRDGREYLEVRRMIQGGNDG